MIELILDEFQFSTLWNGGILLYVLFSVILYLFLLPNEENHKKIHTFLFLAGLLVLYIAVGSPINMIARIKFSSHIIQIVLLLLVVPPLLIIGFKKKLVAQLMSIAIIKRIFNYVSRPWVAIITFFILFYVYHIPVVFDYVRVDLYLNYFYLLALFISAILLWLPILDSNALLKQTKLKYWSFISLLLCPFSFVLIYMETSLYTIYTNMDLFIKALEFCLPVYEKIPPETYMALLPFAPVEEQKFGGMILFASQIVIFGSIIIYNKRRVNNIQPK